MQRPGCISVLNRVGDVYFGAIEFDDAGIPGLTATGRGKDGLIRFCEQGLEPPLKNSPPGWQGEVSASDFFRSIPWRLIAGGTKAAGGGGI